MESPIGQKHKQLEFALASVSELSSCSSVAQSKPVVARFSADSGVAELRFQQESESIAAINVDLQTAKVSFSFLFFFRVYFFDCSFGCQEVGGKEGSGKENRLNFLSIIIITIILLLFSCCGDRAK